MKSRPVQVLLLVMVLILYGSLFPWRFRVPARYLLHRWDAAAGSYLVHDVAVNVALYIPLGLAAGFVFDGPFGSVLLGLALACVIEFVQLYIPTRHAAIIDILANTAGAVTGYVLAVLVRSVPAEWAPTRVSKWVPWMFLLAVAAVRLLPLEFGPAPDRFEWLPFGLLLEGNPQAGLTVLAAKAICYTGAVLFFRLSGWRNLSATALVTAAVVLMEVARIHVPGTQPGITDPVIAAIGGFLVASVVPSRLRRS